jgi:hypothetical protein
MFGVLTMKEKGAMLGVLREGSRLQGSGIAAAGKCPQTCYPGAASLHWFARCILCCWENEGLCPNSYTLCLCLLPYRVLMSYIF